MIAKEVVGQSSRSKGECVSCSLIFSQICGTGLIRVTSRWRPLHVETHEKEGHDFHETRFLFEQICLDAYASLSPRQSACESRF